VIFETKASFLAIHRAFVEMKTQDSEMKEGVVEIQNESVVPEALIEKQ